MKNMEQNLGEGTPIRMSAYILVMGVPEWKENGAEQIILKKKLAKSQI